MFNYTISCLGHRSLNLAQSLLMKMNVHDLQQRVGVKQVLVTHLTKTVQAAVDFARDLNGECKVTFCIDGER